MDLKSSNDKGGSQFPLGFNKKAIIATSVIVGVLLLVGVSYRVYYKANKVEKSSKNTANTNQAPSTLPITSTNPVTSTETVISDIQATNVTQDSVVIKWKTNKALTSIVDYGIEDGKYIWTTGDGSKTIDHSIQIAKLSSNTIYYFRVKSTEEVNNKTKETVVGDNSFKTLVKVINIPNNINNNSVTTTLPSTNTPNKTSNIITYQNDFADYEFQYSSDKWLLVEIYSKELIQLKPTVSNSEQNSLVQIGVEYANGKDLEEVAKELEARKITVNRITFAGVPAIQFSENHLSKSTVQDEVYMINKNRIYRLVEEKEASVAESDLVKKSFKFTESCLRCDTYKNSVRGYEFKYDSKKYMVQDNGVNGSTLKNYRAPGENVVPGTDDTVVTVSVSDATSTLGEIEKRQQDYYGKYDFDQSRFLIGYITIGGTRALINTYSTWMDGAAVVVIVYMIDDNKLYTITSSSYNNEAINDVINTLTLSR